jgi:hypothetical protein
VSASQLIKLGGWKSKKTNLHAKLVKVDEDKGCVWYEIPHFNGWNDCSIEVWLGSMEPVEVS